MKKITLITSALLISSGLLIFLLNSCSITGITSIEKRIYRHGFYVQKSPSEKEIQVVSKQKTENDLTNNVGEKTIETALTADNTGIVTVNSVKEQMQLILQNENKLTSTNNEIHNNNQGNSKKEKNDFIKISTKKTLIKAIKKDITNSVVLLEEECPDNGKNLRRIGFVLMLIGLLFLLLSGASVILAVLGLLVGLVGLIVYLVGQNTPIPYITKTEQLAIEYPQEKQNKLKIPVFDYKPNSKSDKKPLVSLALVNPRYADEFEYKGIRPFTDFAESMKADFNEMLNERRYTFRGPYSDYDDFVYNDKAQTDLLLEIDIDIKLNNENIKSSTVSIPTYSNEYWSCGIIKKIRTGQIDQYTFGGDLTVSGRINIKALK